MNTAGKAIRHVMMRITTVVAVGMVVTAVAPRKIMTSFTARCANVWILSTKTRVWFVRPHTLGTRTVTLAITTRNASMMAVIAALKKQQKAMQAGGATISVQRKTWLSVVPAPARYTKRYWSSMHTKMRPEPHRPRTLGSMISEICTCKANVTMQANPHLMHHAHVQTKVVASTCSEPCHALQWKADGNCDDQNNICGCDWDGGDCCGTKRNLQYCSQCLCRDPKYVQKSK